MSVGERVQQERETLHRMHTATAAAAVLALTCGVLALGALVFGAARWVQLPRSLPAVFWALIVVGDCALVVWAMRWIRTRGTAADVAAAIEREQSLRSGAIRGVLEVEHTGALGRHAADRMLAQLDARGPSLLPVVHGDARRRLRWVGAVGLMTVALLGITAPAFGDGLLAVLRPDRAWRGSLLPQIEFEGLPAAVMQGQRFRVRISAPGRRSITLRTRVPGESWESTDIAVSADAGIATATLGPMRGDLHIAASDGRATTDTVVVRAVDRPFVGSVTLRATYPAYLGRPPESLPVGEAARVPYGTIIAVAGRASTDLIGVHLVSGHDSVALGLEGFAFSGQFEAKRPATWQWAAQDLNGTISDAPPPIELDVIPDSLPVVAITSPSADTVVASTDRLTLHIDASDDHGLVRVDLSSWRVGADGARHAVTTQQLAAPRDAVWSGTADLDLASRDLQPGDGLHVQVVATDNSPWAQRGESRELILQIPSTDERRAMARDLGDSAVAAAQAMVKREDAIEQRTDAMARERGARNPTADGQSASSSNDLSYESAEKARALAKDQRTLTDQVKQLQQREKTLEEQLRQAGALDSSLARQLEEAQALLRDALTPDLLAQMQKLEGAAQQLSRPDAQATLKDLEAMQQRLRDQLEKSAELLNRAALEGSMQTLGDEAKSLAARDAQLADSIAGSARPQTKARDAQQLADQTTTLQQAIQKLESRLEQQQATDGATHATAAEQHAAAAADDLRAASKDSAARSATDRTSGQSVPGGSMEQDARAAATQMGQATQAMQEARDAQVQSWKQELSSTLDQSIQEMLQMSRQESALEQQLRSSQGPHPDVRGAQSAIKQGLDDVAKRLQAEAQKSALLSNRSQQAVSDAEQKAEQAVRASSSTSGAPEQTAGAMEDAVQSLNRAAASLARDREHVNTATSATGFAEMMQELQDLAKKQGAINSQAQSLLSMPGSVHTSAAQAAARALAQQQRQVARQLDDLGDAPGGDQAAKLAEQAKQVADALDNGQLNPQTLARQDQLFHRMLDAGRSLQNDDREDGEHRQATAAKGDEHFTPTNTNSSGKSAVRFPPPTWDELRGLSADERRAVLEYFQRINGGP